MAQDKKTQEGLQQRFCLMLAFQTMITHGNGMTEDTAQKIIELAKRMDEFCNLKLSKAFSEQPFGFAEDRGATKTDSDIAIYVEELRTHGSTELPQDKESLILLYDRLQTRKARRMQLQFYTTAKEEKVADMVLHLLDEEIEDGEVRT